MSPLWRGLTMNPYLTFYLVMRRFPLKMRPFPGQLDEDEKVFNNRQSRGRSVIENTLGILRARWRMLGRPIKATVENVERYLLAINALHSYLRQTEMEKENGEVEFIRT